MDTRVGLESREVVTIEIQAWRMGMEDGLSSNMFVLTDNRVLRLGSGQVIIDHVRT